MKLNKYFTSNFLAFIGFIFLIFYVWHRFIRELYRSVLTPEQRLAHDRVRLENTHNELIEPNNRPESIISSSVLAEQYKDPRTMVIDAALNDSRLG